MAKQETPEFNLESILSNPVDAKTLKGFIDEACLSKSKIRSENEAITDIRNEAKDKLGMPPSLFNHLVKTKFNEDLEKEHARLEATDQALTKLYGVSGAKGEKTADNE